MQLLTPVLVGRSPLDGGVLWNVMYDLMRERGYYGGFMLDAISACDIALWDARGKLLDQPVYQLLGGAYRETIPCYVSGLPKPTDPERVALALDWTTKGFRAFKLAAGFGVKEDTASIAALRNALGPDSPLLLDAHWVYSLDESVRLGRNLEALDAAVLEAPINPEDIDAHVGWRAPSRSRSLSARRNAHATSSSRGSPGAARIYYNRMLGGWGCPNSSRSHRWRRRSTSRSRRI